jgi:hypothetical protein
LPQLVGLFRFSPVRTAAFFEIKRRPVVSFGRSLLTIFARKWQNNHHRQRLTYSAEPERPVVLPVSTRRSKLRQYLMDHPGAFDPETISILSGALDDAWQMVGADKAAFRMDGHPEGARNALAKHIVDIAKQGERDRQRLIEGALAALRL